MSKRYLKELVEKSYTQDGLLNEEVVIAISNLLTRNNLKKYINLLKLKEQKSTVIIKSSVLPTQQEIREFEKEYQNKKIEYITDPSLLVGVEIVDNDIVYNKNLKYRLENLASHISENHDN